MSLRDLAQFAEGEARRLAAKFGLDPTARTDKTDRTDTTDWTDRTGCGSRAYVALAQTVKLGEEVGELQAEVLGALELQRKEKAGRFSPDTLGGELADVMVCVALLADTFGVDLARALASKIERLDARSRRAE
jgi:NTP pyrophosphatase (non-canonical NTP hydrolase)